MKSYRDKFAAYLRRRYSDRSTPKHYLNDLDMFIQYSRQSAPEQITMQEIDGFIDYQVNAGLKPSTINRRLATLHTFFEYLAMEPDSNIEHNPVIWRRHRVKEGNRLPRDASDVEVERLFAMITQARDRAMFGLMVGAGLRVGEVATVKIEGLERPVPPGESARLRVCGKGQKERIVWVTPRWYAEVAAWLVERGDVAEKALFLNQHGRPLSVSGIQYCLKQYCQNAGITLSCHQLRHTFARRLAEQKMPTESISQLLGHANVSTTQLYTSGANPDLKEAFLEAMSQLSEKEIASERAIVPVTRGKRQTEKPDPDLLAHCLGRLQVLPGWLLPVVESYFRRRWQNWQAHTMARLGPNLAGQLVRLWQWLLEERALEGWSSLAREDVDAWMMSRQEQGIKANTIRTELSTLKACFQEALTLDIPISANLLRLKPPKKKQPLPRYLDPEATKRLVETVMVATDAPGLPAALERAWFLTLAHTGIRCGELLDLRLGDLDFVSSRLYVNSGKNGDERLIYLTPTLSAALAHYLTLRPASTDDHLWLYADGSRLKAQQLNYRLRRWGEECHVSVSPHRLRHTLATQLVNQGMPLASVAKLLGHRTLNMTQHYARLYERTVKEQFETATAHIEGILAVDWPQSHPIEAVSVQELTDSV
jgi:site-specific recombinase XerD